MADGDIGRVSIVETQLGSAVGNPRCQCALAAVEAFRSINFLTHQTGRFDFAKREGDDPGEVYDLLERGLRGVERMLRRTETICDSPLFFEDQLNEAKEKTQMLRERGFPSHEDLNDLLESYILLQEGGGIRQGLIGCSQTVGVLK